MAKRIKVTNGRWWYTKALGETFEVVSFMPEYDDEAYEGVTTAYQVLDDGETRYVLEEDCVEVGEDGNFHMSWDSEEGVQPGEYITIHTGTLSGEYQDIRFTREPDMVEHPSHYTSGKFETIEVIEEITKHYEDGYVAYCVGNALKYLARAPHKHDEPTEDLSKAAKYIEFALAYIEAKGDD
jgi:hypothetical protein